MTEIVRNLNFIKYTYFEILQKLNFRKHRDYEKHQNEIS